MSYRKCAREGCILPALGSESSNDSKYKYCYHDEKINLGNECAAALTMVMVMLVVMVVGLIIVGLIVA